MTKHFAPTNQLSFQGTFNSNGGSLTLESNANVHVNEKVIEKSLNTSSIVNLKLGDGHVVNLRFRPTKGFGQYNFGSFGLSQGIKGWTLQPYAFYLKSQIVKKDVAGAGFELFANPDFVQHVASSAPPGLPACPGQGIAHPAAQHPRPPRESRPERLFVLQVGVQRPAVHQAAVRLVRLQQAGAGVGRVG